MAFDFEVPGPSADALAAVVDEMSGSGLTPLSDEEREQRRLELEIHLAECRRRDEQWSAEYQRTQAAKREVAQRQAAIAAAQARDKANRETRERLAAQARDRELANLRYQVTQSQAWQRNVEQAANNAVRQQHQAALLEQIFADWKAMVSPPPEPEEPEVIVEYQREDDGKLSYPKLQRWFVR